MMEFIRFGRTELRVSRTGFGAIPIQRVGFRDAARVLLRAVEAGVNLFDTARNYTDSEEKIGRALGAVREQVILATKSAAGDRAGLFEDLETSLRNLRTDYVDVLQLHNPTELPDPDDADSTYSALVEARRQGKARFIGITSHRLDNAVKAAQSGLYDTVQFPLCAISTPEDLGLIDLCRKHDVGLLAMKALSGGLLSSARAAFAFLRQYENVVPIWGVERMGQMEEILAMEASPPALDAELLASIARDREELAASFCRACGYCMPCPAGVPIPFAARMGLLLRRMPAAQFLTAEWQEKMGRILKCTRCGQCAEKCPYHLDTPALLRQMYDAYEAFRASRAATSQPARG
jgi:uncharacterized protein